YLLEKLDEQEILAIDAEGDIANCGVTEYAFVDDGRGGALKLKRYNFVAPIFVQGAPVTSEPERNAARR
ncbi:MAG: phosphoglycerate mutase, partial [Tardiphaga sp.]|nr:phosphoglycerate mutase [Tardiphaga sp.]